MSVSVRHQRLQGFSMLEALLSIFVMSVGLMTVVAVMSGSLRFSYDTRDTIVAAELAQEGVELVRNVRDNDFAAGNDGFTDFEEDKNNKHCRIDWNDPTDDLNCQPNQGANSRYYLQYAGDTYAHVNATKERYARYIYIDYSAPGGDRRATIRSFVSWGAFDIGSIPNDGDPDVCNDSPSCLYTESFLTDWHTNP